MQDKNEESYYDEEEDVLEDESEEKSSSSEPEDNEPAEEEQKLTEEEQKKKQEKMNAEFGDPGDGFEWASDVDSQGKQIWGKEGEDFEWYYQEDKESYERGESTLPPLLNPRQITDKNYTEKDKEYDRMKMYTSVKAKLAKDESGALYRTKKKLNRTGGGFV